jgi:hypothetical protein
MIANLAPHSRLREFLMCVKSKVILACKNNLNWHLNNFKVVSDFETEFNYNYFDSKKILMEQQFSTSLQFKGNTLLT